MHFIRLILGIIFLFLAPLLSAKEALEEELVIPMGGVPGQIVEEGVSRKIFFENGISVEWKGLQLILRDQNLKQIDQVNLQDTSQKEAAKQALGTEVIEQDLGGALKKKAPLAYKNPLFREIKVPRGAEDPLKSSGMQPSKVSEQNTPEGGKEIVTEYPDGSKSVSYNSAQLKEESSFNKKGELVWRNIEGVDRGYKFKKTQWQDGSLIREFSTSDGILSVVFDADGRNQTFSFLRPNREIIKEESCQNGNCEAN